MQAGSVERRAAQVMTSALTAAAVPWTAAAMAPAATRTKHASMAHAAQIAVLVGIGAVLGVRFARAMVAAQMERSVEIPAAALGMSA